MVNEIQPNGSTTYSNGINRVESSSGVAPNQENKPAEQTNHPRFDLASAEVSFSDDARTLQAALKAAKEIPDIRADVVSNIQAQIETNRYQIDYESLADRLLPLLQ